MCKAGKLATTVLSNIPCITTIVVALATLLPSHIGNHLVPSDEPKAVILMMRVNHLVPSAEPMAVILMMQVS
jgi:hypothetical protein